MATTLEFTPDRDHRLDVARSRITYAPEMRHKPFSSLYRPMNRNLFLLLQGQFVSNLGTQAALTATVFLITQATGSATIVGGVMALCALPTVIAGPAGGALADHFPRRAILIVCDLAGGAAMVVLAFYLRLFPFHRQAILIGLCAASVFVAFVEGFFLPAVTALIPDLAAEADVQKAMSTSQALNLVSSIIGEAAAGLFLNLAGPWRLFVSDGISYWYAALSESQVRLSKTLGVKNAQSFSWQGFRRQIVEGVGSVWAHAGIRALFLTALPLNLFTVPLFVLLPFYVSNQLHQSAAWYGYMLAGFGSGSLAGYAATATTRGASRNAGIMTASTIGVSVLLASLGLIRNPWLALLTLFVMGFLVAVVTVVALTVLQTAAPVESRGRVFGLLTTLSQGLTPVAMCLAGFIGDISHGRVRWIYFCCGVAALVVALRASANRPLRRLFEKPVFAGSN